MAVRSLSKRLRRILSDILMMRYTTLLTAFLSNPQEFCDILDTTDAVLASRGLRYLVDFGIPIPPRQIHIFCKRRSSYNIVHLLYAAGYRSSEIILRGGRKKVITYQETFTKGCQSIIIESAESSVVVFTYNHFLRTYDYIVASGSGFVVAYPHHFSSNSEFGIPTAEFFFHNDSRRFGDSKCLSVGFTAAYANVVTRYRSFLPIWHENEEDVPMIGFGLDNKIDISRWDEQNRIFRSSLRYF